MNPRTRQRALWGGAIATAILLVVLVGAFREALADRDATAVATIATAHVEHILGPEDFKGLGDDIGPEFGVTENRAVVLPVGGVLRVTDGQGLFDPHLIPVEIVGHQPDSFALDPRGPMLAIADGYFGVLDRQGEIVHGIPIPYSGAQLAPSVHDGATYLFGGTANDYRLYRLIDDGTLQIVLKSDEPIVAAADNTDSIYAATATQIMRIKAGAFDVLFKTPDDEFAGPIRSLAVTRDGVVVFSTDTKVYALLGPNALSIVNDAGGTLRVRDDVLYVLDPQRKIVFSLSPASAQLFETAAP